MRLARFLRDADGARRASALLLGLLGASMAANLALALLALHASGRERVVIVPPTVHRSFWVEPERVSAAYLEEMAYFLVQLTLDVTPQGAAHQAATLLQHAAASAAGELRTSLQESAERLKRDGASTQFSVQELITDEPHLRVGVRGQLTTYVSDRRVSQTQKGYALEFQVSAGRIQLKSFRETTPNDPLETQPRAGTAAAVQ